MFALIQSAPSNYQIVVEEVFRLVGMFIREDSFLVAEAIFATIMVFHALVGAAELVSGKESRLTSGPFWVRVLFTMFFVVSFDAIFVRFGQELIQGCMTGIFQSYMLMWGTYTETCGRIVDEAFARSGTWAIIQMATSALFETMVSAIGLGIATLIGFLLMFYMVVQSFVALGSAAVVLALGPIALVFAAHESTQDIAVSYVKTFLVYVVLYMPLLLLAFQVAMIIMTHVSLITGGATASGIGRSIEKAASIIAAPFAAAAFIFAVPNVIKSALK